MKYIKINRISNFALYAVLIVALGACAATQKKEMTLKQSSTATDVFREVQNGEAAEKGLVDLVIRASVKTPVAGFHFFETETHLHGKPGYPFLFNIDGQAATWKVDGVTGDGRDVAGKDKDGPEVGLGVKYVMEKRIRLAPGSHRVFFSLPDENYFTENAIMLKGGMVNVLEYRPVYRKPSRGNRRDFEHGVEGCEVFLNSSRIES
jgi:hypothetical protein